MTVMRSGHHSPRFHPPPPYRLGVPYLGRAAFKSAAVLLLMGILLGGTIGYLTVKAVDVAIHSGIVAHHLAHHGSSSRPTS